MTAYGARLKLRLFLEGVEVPVVAATITSQKNSAASAAIQIPANDYGLDLKPRTLVHLFAYDGYKGAPPESQVWVGGAGISVKQQLSKDPDKEGPIPKPDAVANSPTLTTIDLENQNFKLIFGGEVVAIHYSKSPTSRGMNLQCVDWSSYWDIAYQYQVGGMSLGFGNLNQAFTGASTTLFSEFLKTSGDVVLELLNSPPRSYPELQGSLLGGLMHIIEAIGGCYFGPRAVKGTNDFFSLAEMRLHLTQMIGANPRSAKDEIRLLRANGFGSLFGKTLGGLGKLVTIRQVLNALQRYIFHEVIPITAPRYVPAKASSELSQTVNVPLQQSPKTAGLSQAAKKIKRRAQELKEAQKRATNISVGGAMTDFTQLARAADEAYRKSKNAAASSGVGATTGGLQQVASAFETARQQINTIGQMVQIKGSVSYEFPPMDTGEATRVIQLFDMVIKAMDRVNGTTYKQQVPGAQHQPHPPPRLITQVYRPDVWMVAPPRCNVIFPELYSQFSYGRNFLAEVTRMLLRTHEAFYGSDFLFDGHYMAPSKVLGARSAKVMGRGRMDYEPPDLSDAPASVLKDMMDHELYTGISPAFERMSDLNLHAIRGGSIEYEGVGKIGYAQLAVNHIFFQYRYRSRDLQVSGKFNPYLALGFPAVIIDKYVSDDKLRGGYDSVMAKRLAMSFANLPPKERQNVIEVNAAKVDQLANTIMEERYSTHYLGTPEMISHSLSATSGGSTQYQMAYARTTTEKTQFFGDNVGQAGKTKKKGKKNPYNIVAARSAPKVGSTGVLGGKIVEVTNVTSEYQRAQPSKGKAKNRHGSSKTLPLFEGANQVGGRKDRATRVPVGVDKPAADYGPEVIAIVGSGGSTVAADGAASVRFEAYKIVEEVGQYIVADQNLPPEQLLFPPWYGEDYRTHKIGALYSDFFGVGAITDPTIVLGNAVEHKFGEGDPERTLRLDIQSVFEAVLAPEQHPPAGMSSTPTPAGGGTYGTDREGNEREVLGEVEARSPVAEAIGEIVKVYSATRTAHYDTPSFVQNFTWRPIASMVDIFGTSDLHIDERGTVLSGREGFHSRAFGRYDDLRQLVTQDEYGPQKILGLEAAPSELNDEKDTAKKVAQRLDTRKEKQEAVFRYLTALAASRGVLLG